MRLNGKKHIRLLWTIALPFSLLAQPSNRISQWITTPDRGSLFQLQPAQLSFSVKGSNQSVIRINEMQRYQQVDGFGFALTGGSAQAIIQMTPAARKSLLNEIFGTKGDGIGVSYLRLSIGASDLNDHVFSYDDMPAGEADTAMTHFDLGPDKENVIPVLNDILAINPAIKLLGSPWSPPAWMKTNGDTRGGRLRPEYYSAYAKYLVTYIRQMKAAGIVLDAITVQNEPLHPGNNPSLLMVAPDEADFVKNNLGPAFRAAHISTKILVYDHNADRPDYPLYILDDPAAAKYIDGSAFHLYAGEMAALTTVHDAHPEKNIYFTEQMVVDFGRHGVVDTTTMRVASPVSRLFVGAMRNWSRNVLLWNLAADPQYRPFTDRGGCSICQGAVTIDGDRVSRNLAFYAMAHAAKLVRPGSIRIGSTETDHLSSVAFRTPGGKIVLIVANTGKTDADFDINYKNGYASVTLQTGAAATFSW